MPFTACYLKLYKLPFGATDRSFMCHAVLISPDSSSTQKPEKQDDKSASSKKAAPDSGKDGNGGPREFLVFSLPITTPTEPKEGKKYVRGTQATVERVRELEGGEIEWTCASVSTPGGNIPVRLSESKMCVSPFPPLSAPLSLSCHVPSLTLPHAAASPLPPLHHHPTGPNPSPTRSRPS